MNAYANKGTLVPGQTIQVNNYTVQVEKYLSQGGFAHVYLVRTPQPVYGTTHHVLKRIAVANDAMLAEVKKEVDIMRILRGHPNIVYLIDASWNKLPNGTTEAFVLMEFCQGGGIIDMMNRRLRERLTEAEILTIFVDVCEGVAAMHHLKPPLLHRDLKVENILQASATSYKLCDFGSSAPVSKPPQSTNDIRILEADLNRHTTLQYRAPEMVDVYLRRPIDEKSDIWALGVLLYKLCYYTTPFEEHGPLAILNVQYKIPPYPVYSQQMNAVIASMLREHGVHRPSVFELLNVVHAMRGTKSRFTYNVPSAPVVSPSQLRAPTNPLDNVISYRSRSSDAASPSKADGLQARERVLEAIAPMRRGRPGGPSPAPPSPVHKPDKPLIDGLGFIPDSAKAGKAHDDPWGMGGGSINSAVSSRRTGGTAAPAENRFADSFSGAITPQRTPAQSQHHQQAPAPKPIVQPAGSRPAALAPPEKPRDAFAGLGIGIPEKRAPTLGEARKMRTGLASMGSYTSPTRDPSAGPTMAMGMGSASASPAPNASARQPGSLSAQTPSLPPRPSPSPRTRPPSTLGPPSPLPGSKSSMGPPSPAPHGSSAPPSADRTAEERFPSLEELDRTFTSPPARSPMPSHPLPTPTSKRDGERAALGAAMRDTPKWMTDYGVVSLNDTGSSARRAKPEPTQARPPLERKYRSSVITKTTSIDSPSESSPVSSSQVPSRMQQEGDLVDLSEPSAGLRQSALPPRDWLTGDDDDSTHAQVSRAITSGQATGIGPGAVNAQTPVATGAAAANLPPETPVLRDAPSKRASYIEGSGIKFQSPKQGVTGEAATPEATGAPIPSLAAARQSQFRSGQGTRTSTTTPSSVTGGRPLPKLDTRADNKAPSHGLTDNWSPVKSNRPQSRPSSPTKKPSSPVKQSVPQKATGQPRRKSRDATRLSSDSSEDGPEDAGGFNYRRGGAMADRAAVLKEAGKRPKARQGSVHDLVDLYGGVGSGLPSSQGGDVVLGSGVSLQRRSSAAGYPSHSSATMNATPLARTRTPQPTGTGPSLTNISPNKRPLPPATMHKKQASAAQNNTSTTSSPIPRSVASPSTASNAGRSRPQSMFISPVSATKSMGSAAPAPAVPSPRDAGLPIDKSAVPSPATTSAGLNPPPDKHPRAQRRSSISDMVSMYESMGTAGPAGAPGKLIAAPVPPTLAPKPAGLRVATPMAAAMGSGEPGAGATAQRSHSPSLENAAARFPKLSPANSPVMARRELWQQAPTSVPPFDEAPPEPTKGRTSPVVSRRADPALPVPSSAGTNGYPSAPPPQQQRSRSPVPGTEPASATPSFARTARRPTVSTPTPTAAAPADETGIRAPSPDKPYQGVGRLIDRWQKNIAEAGGDVPQKRNRAH